MDLRDIIPWSLIWGAQNQRHKAELDRTVLLGVTPKDTEWVTACDVAAKLLPQHKWNPDAIELEEKPSESFLAGMRKAGLLVAVTVFDKADPNAYLHTLDEDNNEITVYRPSLYRVGCDKTSMEAFWDYSYGPPYLPRHVTYL